MAKKKGEEPKLLDNQKEEWGILHCAACEKPIAHFPPDSPITKEMDLELYCADCKGKVI